MIDNSSVERLLKKASDAHEAHHAMNFAQAALNAAHALAILNDIKPKDGRESESFK